MLVIRMMVSLARDLTARLGASAVSGGPAAVWCDAFARDERVRAARIEQLLGAPGRYGGDATRQVRRLRIGR